MTYQKLHTFLTNQIRMSHIYQPVMLKRIFLNDGSASVNEIAKDLLSYDQSQIEYYEDRTKNMVGKVLTNNRNITLKDGDQYLIDGFDRLSVIEKQELIKFCDELIEEYLAKRKQTLYDHRRISSDYVPGSLRYQVLSQAKGRCELWRSPRMRKPSTSTILSQNQKAGLTTLLIFKPSATPATVKNGTLMTRTFGRW